VRVEAFPLVKQIPLGMTDRKAKARATARTTAGLSTPLRFAQDDSIVGRLMKEQRQEQPQMQGQRRILRFAQDDNHCFD
jgi:hypothetical protein